MVLSNTIKQNLCDVINFNLCSAILTVNNISLIHISYQKYL